MWDNDLWYFCRISEVGYFLDKNNLRNFIWFYIYIVQFDNFIPSDGLSEHENFTWIAVDAWNTICL